MKLKQEHPERECICCGSSNKDIKKYGKSTSTGKFRGEELVLCPYCAYFFGIEYPNQATNYSVIITIAKAMNLLESRLFEVMDK